jgi:hypothetical protein
VWSGERGLVNNFIGGPGSAGVQEGDLIRPTRGWTKVLAT